MTYSKNIKKTTIGKRVLISWLVTFVIAFAIGIVAGFVIRATTYKADATETTEAEIAESTEIETLDETAAYGTVDGRTYSNLEAPIDYNSNLIFTPLDVDLDEDIQEFIFYLSSAYDIDWTFTMAIIQKESNYKSGVISSTGDYGLMQINVINHEYITETLGITDFINPYENVRAGLWILRNLFEKYETPEKVLMAYNLGETGASRLWEQGIFETNYSKAVLEIQDELKGVNTDD